MDDAEHSDMLKGVMPGQRSAGQNRGQIVDVIVYQHCDPNAGQRQVQIDRLKFP